MSKQPVIGRRQQLAAANRERLIAAAEELIAERGLALTLNDVAHRAGVGIGTAYRRFANKEHLFDALFAIRLDRTMAIARDCLADTDPWHGLTSYLERSLALEVSDRGMTKLISRVHIAPDNNSVETYREQLAPLLDQLVHRAREAGVLRSDIATSDVMFLRSALTSIVEMSRDSAPTLYRRYLAVILDGLRAQPAATPLPETPTSVKAAHAAIATLHWRVPPAT